MENAESVPDIGIVTSKHNTYETQTCDSSIIQLNDHAYTHIFPLSHYTTGQIERGYVKIIVEKPVHAHVQLRNLYTDTQSSQLHAGINRQSFYHCRDL